MQNLTIKLAAKMHVTRWWMMHYGAETAKRTVGFSNNQVSKLLDKGTLPRKEMIAKTKYKLATSTTSSTGKKQASQSLRYMKPNHLPAIILQPATTCLKELPNWLRRPAAEHDAGAGFWRSRQARARPC